MEVCINIEGVCTRRRIILHTRDETLKDEKQHDAEDKSTSKQQVCVSDGSFLCCAKNWTHTPSDSGSYSRQIKALLS